MGTHKVKLVPQRSTWKNCWKMLDQDVLPAKCPSQYPLSASTLLAGWQEGHPACRKSGCWFVNWSFARLIAPVVSTTSITLSSNKMHNGTVKLRFIWKMAIKMERETAFPMPSWQCKSSSENSYHQQCIMIKHIANCRCIKLGR